MNLNLSIGQICATIGARFLDNGKLTQQEIIKHIVIDSRSPLINSSSLFALFKGQRTDGANFVGGFYNKGGRIILTDAEQAHEGISQFIVPDVTIALQEIAKFHRSQFNIPVIGITGSNGKTTVKEWLYHVLKDDFLIVRSPKSFNSQIGVALSLLEISSEHELAIIEAGISKPGEMDRLLEMIQPTIGLFTGIGDAHQAAFESREEKKLEKFKLFKDVETLIQISENKVKSTSAANEQDFEFEITKAGTLSLSQLFQHDLTLPIGLAGAGSNAALVAVTANQLGVDSNKIEKRMKSLPIISMRLEKIKGNNNNLIINDAYSIDEQSLEMGLRFLATNKGAKKAVVFLGEDAKLADKDNSLLNMIQSIRSKIAMDDLYYIGSADIARQFDFITATFPNAEAINAEKLQLENCAILFTGSRSMRLERAVSGFTEKKHITRLLVNLSAIRHNLQYYKKQLEPGVKVLAMVKSQSYGGGLTPIAEFLEDQQVDYFGVAYADEGVMLRNGGVKTPILVMNPEPAAFDEMIEKDLEPAIYSLALLNDFIHQLILRGKTNFPIHIKLETGMNRLGFRNDQLQGLIDLIITQPEVFVKSIFSHLAVADDPKEESYTLQQINFFEKGIDQIENAVGYKTMRHIANSSAALSNVKTHYDMVRLGIGLFGLTNHPQNKNLEQALIFVSQISQIRNIKAGETVGYGRSFLAEKDIRMGVVPVGYGDGLRRQLSNGKWHVKIGNDFYPIIGRICMDMCMIDLGSSNHEAGAEVQLFGPGNTVKEMAAILGTIPYEILTSISGRVQRVYLSE